MQRSKKVRNELLTEILLGTTVGVRYRCCNITLTVGTKPMGSSWKSQSARTCRRPHHMRFAYQRDLLTGTQSRGTIHLIFIFEATMRILKWCFEGLVKITLLGDCLTNWLNPQVQSSLPSSFLCAWCFLLLSFVEVYALNVDLNCFSSFLMASEVFCSIIRSITMK